MVSVKIVSRYAENFPGPNALAREIATGPLYPADEILELLTDGNDECIVAWTHKCTADIQNLALGPGDLVELLKEAVSVGRFIGSEWSQGKRDGPWAACDAYALIRQEWMEVARREMRVEYYLKFAIGITGKILLLVSCHLSQER